MAPMISIWGINGQGYYVYHNICSAYCDTDIHNMITVLVPTINTLSCRSDSNGVNRISLPESASCVKLCHSSIRSDLCIY